jgi:GFO/IDH/MocA oxidoreductase family protein
MAEFPKVTGLRLKNDPRIEPIRVCVIGARRVRNGTGPYLARQLADAGAELSAVLGTTPATVADAREALAADGYPCDAYTNFETMVNEVRPDVLVIATPAGTHRPWLEAALHHELHVLCEKPLLTVFDPEAALLPYRFAAVGRIMVENCQWPNTLAAFAELHPDCELGKVSQFRMMLAPEFRGLSRWIETLSHPLSLLQAVVHGPAELQNIRFQESGPAAADARLNFEYCALDRTIDCEVVMQDTGVRPRPAEYALDDYVCRRQIAQPGYQFFFDDGYRPEGTGDPRKVESVDPQVSCVEDFLQRVLIARVSGAAPANENLARRQRLLSHLLAAYTARCKA